MITIKNGPEEFKGELHVFDPGSQLLVFRFKSGTELHFTNPPERLIHTLIKLGLHKVKDAVIDYHKCTIAIQQQPDNRNNPKKSKPTEVKKISKIIL